jgi:iron complex outermembrane receptor protein
MKKLLAGASLLPFLCAGIAAHAADATAGAGEVSEVIVTGTRQVGVKAEDSAAPIQVVGARNLTLTGSTELAQSLAVSVPSLNIQTNGGDAAAVNIQAALRGVSPNDTLVLVDGKRRHGTSNLAVLGGSPYSGSATTDLSFIPIGAIDHVEVLTDGAAAQYGTDAIAGVINIITKKGTTGTLDITGGQYYDSNGTNFQGTTGSISINKGFNLGDKGYMNVTFENRYHDYSVQGCGDSRFQAADCSLASGLTFPNSNVTKFPGYPHENQLDGDPQYNIYNGFLSAGYQVTPNIELYTIDSYGYRAAQHFENYRTPSKIVGTAENGVTVYPLPNGFDPKEKYDEKDYSVTGGMRGAVDGFHYDLSGTYGGNNVQVYTVDSANADLFSLLQSQSATPVVPQTSFYDGEYKATELTLNADFNKDFAVNLASPLSVAFGAEYRRDTYGIGAGEPSASFGGGAQSFPGYTPLDQGDFSRTNYAGYVDLAVDPIKNLHLDLAGRFEHYSDFGDTEVGKLTARYDFNPMFALRGTVSNGFRAPTLAEEHYSGTNVSPYSADVQLPPNSSAAQLAGFSSLKPEWSQNYSIGFVAHPIDNLQITLDAYQINIHDRILVSGFIYGTETIGGKIVTVSQGVLNAITARGAVLDSGLSYTGISIFANAANTRTDGIEMTANYASDFGDYGHVDWSVGANYNKTQLTKTPPLPAAVTSVQYGQTTFFTPNAASALTTATPREKVILQAYYTWHKFSANLRETVYGPTRQWSANNALFLQLPTTGITDLDIGYRITPMIKVDAGANNLFNQIPTRAPITAGGRVYDVPYTFAPWGGNGGYYYGRVVVTF